MLTFPPFRLDPDEERLWKGETLLALRRKPFAILRHLVAHPNKLVTHEELLAAVWGRTAVSESAVRSHLHELRQVLGEGVIETVIGRGYRFVAELAEELAPREASTPPAIDPLVVGRVAELGVLRDAFARASGGHRQICFVSGDPGIGKSTLVARFLAELDPAQVIIGQGHCIEQHGTAEAYLAIIEAIAALTRSKRGGQVLAGLVRYAPTFVSHVPHLVSDEQLDEVMRRARGGTESKLVRELSEALEAVSSQDVTVLVLEDLQWSDIATIDLLALVGQRTERAKLLVIGTTRRAEVASPDHPLNRVMRTLVARSGARSVSVERITVDSVRQFMDLRFPAHRFPPQLSGVVFAITGGIPLFMVSLLDDLVVRGMLVERDGAWTTSVSLEEIAAHRPDSVKQLIDMQLDRMTTADQRILEAASLLGGEVSPELIAAALEQPVEDVDESCLALARQTPLLRREGAGYVMTHALVREVCAQRSAVARRQRWHRLIAEALEREHGTRATEVAHTLAMHFDAGQVPARAVHYYVEAGEQTALRLAATDAVASFARALELVPRLPPGAERDALELRILCTVGQLMIRSSTDPIRRDPFELHARTVTLARSLGDIPRLFVTLADVGVRHAIVGQLGRANEIARELAGLAVAHSLDPDLVEYGTNARAMIAFYRGEVAVSEALYATLALSTASTRSDAPAVHRAALDGPVGRVAVARSRLAVIHWLQGDPERALEDARAAIELATHLEDNIVLGITRSQRIRTLYLRRDPREKIHEAAQEMVRSGTAGKWVTEEARVMALWAAQTELDAAGAAALLASYEDRLARGALGSTSIAMPMTELLRTHHAPLAAKVVALAISHATTSEQRVYLPELYRLRGELLETTDHDGAVRDYRAAIALAQELGEPPFLARATASLARIS